jgi:RHS repeat-associated protein
MNSKRLTDPTLFKTGTDARGITATYTHDALNRLTAITYPDSSRNVTYRYDTPPAPNCRGGERYGVGRLTAMTDHSGTTQYCYDRYGQLSRKLQTTAGRSFVLWYVNTDPRGRIPASDTVSRNPPPGNQHVGTVYPDGASLSIARDAMNRPVELTVSYAERQQTRTLLRNATYAPFGPATQWAYGNGRVMTRTVNRNYQPGIVQDSAAGGLSLGYEFDEVGNLKTLRNGNQTDPPLRRYGYDRLNRLVEVKDAANSVREAYGYDGTGNRIAATTAGASSAYGYAADSHRLLGTATTARTYDAAGNTVRIGGAAASALALQAIPQAATRNTRPAHARLDTRLQARRGPRAAAKAATLKQAKTVQGTGIAVRAQTGATTSANDVVREFAYDAANRMSEVRRDGALAASYRYNGKGERVRKTMPGEDIVTVYDEAGRWIGDYTPDGQAIQQAIWLDDLPVGLLVGHGTSQKLYYIQPDALGTPRVLIDPDRDVAVWRWELAGDAFGDHAPNQDPDNDGIQFVFDMRFPGQRFDSASGLNDNYFRDYDPSTGRYVQSDPIGLLGGVSLYGYVGGNPLISIDPLGLAEVIIWEPVGRGSSSFGHVSAIANGRSYSWGTGGWDINRNANRYIQNNRNFRSGMGIVIRLSPVQEYKFEACLQRHGGAYDILTNNCGTPAQSCLEEVGVNDFFRSGETGNTALGVNSRHVLSVDLGNGLLNSRNFGGVSEYPVVNEPTVWDRLQRAPWAWGF